MTPLLKLAAGLLAGACFALAQTPAKAPNPPAASADLQLEQQRLRNALAEAGGSPVDFVRVLEAHLREYPDSPSRPEIERALVKACADNKDDDCLIRYGESVLRRDKDDAQILERTATALLRKGTKPEAERALQYGKHLNEVLLTASKEKADSPREEAKLMDGADRARARAFILLARANGILGDLREASSQAELSYAAYPSVEGAREAARWLSAAGRQEEAIRYLAKAFTISELKAADADSSQDRAKLGELYRQWKGGETGLGDLILQAYDQTSAVFTARRQALRQIDPNSGARQASQFILTGLGGERLALSALRGKVVVMDFWATWCGPCRLQHPLYEQVKAQFKDRDDVVFVAIDTDTDHALVKPFLEQSHWSPQVYFEDGLGQFLEVTSIPTTVILNRRGEIASRMNGFVPERFVELLSDRIREALKEPGAASAAE